MAEKKQEEPTNSSKSLTDSDTSDDTEVNPRFKTSVEEREYDTIPGSANQPSEFDGRAWTTTSKSKD